MAWALVRFLKIRHFRGRRYRLGLPVHTRRTHSNAATTRRMGGVTVRYIRARFWGRKLWEPRKRPVRPVRVKVRVQSKRAAKAERHRRGVIRTKQIKKKSVWR
jgi:hypothetical protein